jgi:organic hydroperoxide reductase OsmC/OhrA
MSEYRATIRWSQEAPDYLRGKYSREHTWEFDGGVTVPASSSPSVVPVPYSNPANVDPEEALVAAISSCHMLSFLYVAQRGGFQVESYEDEAVGVMTKNERGAMWISKTTLHPRVRYTGAGPSAEQEAELHHHAHEQCFIASSVKTEILVEPA